MQLDMNEPVLDADVAEWGADSVDVWLKKVGLAHIATVFEFVDVDGPMLLRLTAEDLEESEELVIEAEDIPKIISAIEGLKNGDAGGEAAAVVGPEPVGAAQLRSKIAKLRAVMAEFVGALEQSTTEAREGSEDEARVLAEECAQMQAKVQAAFAPTGAKQQ